LSEQGSIFGGGKKGVFGEGGSTDVGVVDLNLTPLMDVMSNILFFLLASFGAAIVSFLAASVPVQAEEDSTPAEPLLESVTANLQITPEAYKLNLSNDKVAKEKLDEFKLTIPKVSGQYDRKKLTETLVKVKEKFSKSDTIMIVPNEHTIYEDIVGAMEAAKETRNGNTRMRLFPKAVIADLVKAE
jgi:biopolymer transport protein ExbD